MKYVPLKNQPNVSGTRLASISPSLRMDSRGFPCVSWIDKGLNVNEIKYSFWDGLKWSFYGIPKVYISSESIVFSPNALVLSSSDLPAIAFARKVGLGYRLSLASYEDVWSFSNFDVDYDVGWIGVIQIPNNLDSSSSSSNSSNSGLNHYVAVYDLTNGRFRVYVTNNASWSLLGALDANIDTLGSVRITACGRKMGICHTYDQTIIKYNFLDLDSGSWSFPVEFEDLGYSLSYGDLIDVDMAGYWDGVNSVMAFGWVSRTSTTSYVCSVLAFDDGTELPSNFPSVSPVVKSQSIPVSVSSDYIVNGYRKIAICIDNSSLIRMVAAGTATDYFRLIVSGMSRLWTIDPVDIDGISNGIVANALRVDFSDEANIAFAADSGDIYFYEKSNDTTFPVSSPDVVVLNSKWAQHTSYTQGQLVGTCGDGTYLDGTYNNSIGDILRDATRPLFIVFNGTRYVDAVVGSGGSYTLPSSDVNGVEISYTGADSTTATVILNGVSFQIKNVSGQFVWDSDNAHGSLHTFTALCESLVQIAGDRSYTIIWKGTGSLIVNIQLKEILGTSSSSSSSSFSRSLSSSSSSSNYYSILRYFITLYDEIFG